MVDPQLSDINAYSQIRFPKFKPLTLQMLVIFPFFQLLIPLGTKIGKVGLLYKKKKTYLFVFTCNV